MDDGWMGAPYHHGSVNQLSEEVDLDSVGQKDSRGQLGKDLGVMPVVMANHNALGLQPRLDQKGTEPL